MGFSSLRHMAILLFLLGIVGVINAQALPRGDTIFPVSCFLNIMIILDRSDSVLGGFNRSRDFVIEVSEELNISPKAHSVSMIVYSGTHYKQEVYKWNFAKNNAEFKQAVRDLRTIGGTTNTHKALTTALDLMQSRNTSIPTIVMVVTDGRSNIDPAAPAKQLQGIPQTYVFAAATGDPKLANRNELLAITGNPWHVIMHSARDDAAAITRRLLREAQEKCRTTTTSTTTTTTTTSTTTTTTTTTTTNPLTGCEQDLVLVFDFSTTTSPVYEDYKRMAEQLIKQLWISPRHTRVALVTFTGVGVSSTFTVFNLNKHKTADEVIKEIHDVQYIGGLTSVGQGIREAAKQADPHKGARPDVANKIMVLFTDGWQNKGPDPMQEAKAAQAVGFRILSVSVVDNRSPDAIPVNQETLDIIVNNKHDTFTNRNFQELINIVRQRNLRCLELGIKK